MNLNNLINRFDPEGVIQILRDTYRQIEYAWEVELPEQFDDLSGKIKTGYYHSVVVSGVGGSALIGEMLQNYFNRELLFPLYVNRSYDLPAFADERTLLILSSYSGNTSEVISVFNDALEKNCAIICLSAGGKIEMMAEDLGISFVRLQKGFQPRQATYQSFFVLLKVLQKFGLIKKQDATVDRIIDILKIRGEEYTEDYNLAFTFAQSIYDSIPIVYSAADFTDSVGIRLKEQLNENAKIHSFHNTIPELNHNEIAGWNQGTTAQMNLKLVNIMDESYRQEVKLRFEATSEVVARSGGAVINLISGEELFKERLFDLLFLCDWISYYVALLRDMNPKADKNTGTIKERVERK